MFSGDRALDHRLLLGPAVKIEHGHEREIADDGMLVLQVVMQAEPHCGEVLADDRHPQVGTVAAAVLSRQGKAVMAGRIGEVFRALQQRLPFRARQAAAVEVGARPFAPMIEEADIVVGALDRADFCFDEGVELFEIAGQAARQIEVHVRVR